MPVLYVIPGSPSSWRVWLTLRRMEIDHHIEKLSFNRGDTRSDTYRKLNWRGQVPLLTDGTLILSESFAIIEYLDETYGAAASHPVWPIDPKARARARRIAHATDGNLGARVYRPLADQLFLTEEHARDNDAVNRAIEVGRTELDWLESELADAFFAGPEPCAADFTVYGLIAFLAQIERHHPTAALKAARGPKVEAWRRRIEALPEFPATWPEHWPEPAQT
jgi:glutathione S-transferase